MVDETTMDEGSVNAEGIKNLTALGSLMTEGVLTCDFNNYDVRLPLDVSCVLVTHNVRAVVKDTSVILPIRPAATPDGGRNLEPGALHAVRFLIGLVTRSPKAMEVPDNVCTRFASDFSSIRQELNVAPSLCHTWMALARAFALWQGDNQLTEHRWQMVLEMEHERLRRCKEEGIYTKP